jgi:uncharacterized protein (TIGR00251 family)
MSRGEGQFFTVHDDGVVLAVRAVPKSRRDAIVGLMATPEGQALKIAVTAAPENGKANAAVAALVAKALDVPKSAVSVVSGATDRRKLLRVAGDPAALSHRAQQWIKS